MPDLTQLKEFKNGDILDASELNAMVDQIETKAEESTVAELTAKVNNLETTINKVDISSFASKQDIVDSLSAHTATADNSYFRKEDAVIPIANGGTGATTVQDALDNLHVYSCDNTYHREEICTNDTLHLFGCEIPNNIFEQIGGYWWKRRTEEVGESYTLTAESVEQSFLAGIGETASSETVVNVIYYSTSDTDEKFIVNSDNTFTFNNYLPINWTVSNGEEVREAIAGKYYMVKSTSDAEPTDSVIYFAGDANGDSTYFNVIATAPYYGVTGGGGTSGGEKTINYYIANATKYTAEWKSYTTLGKYEYVHSTNRDTYPDSGRDDIFTYEYLGIPFENARNSKGTALNSHWWKRRVEETGIETYAKTESMDSYGFSEGLTLYYSDTYEANNGIFTLIDPDSVVTGKTLIENELRNKYLMFRSSSGTEMLSTRTEDAPSFCLLQYSLCQVMKYTAKQRLYENKGEYEYLNSENRNAYPDSGKHGLFSYYYLGVPFKNAIEPTHIKKFSYVGDDNWGESKPTVYTADFDIKAVIVNRHHLSVDTDPDTGASKTNNANIYLTDIEIKRSGSSSPLSVRFEGNCVRLWTSENYPATQYNDADYEYTVVLLG